MGDRVLLAGAGLCSVMIWYVGSGIGLIVAINNISIGTTYSNNATKEKCLLMDYEVTECSYECCPADATENDPCAECWGQQYTYEAIAMSKCGNITLFSSVLDLSCPMTMSDIGSEKTCYVLDCDEEEFALVTQTERITWGIVLLCICIFLCICPCCVLFGLAK